MFSRILVVGCGSIGERHLRCFQGTGRADVSACDANPALLQRIGKEYGVRVFAETGSALESGKFDAAVICTPAHTHVPIALAALRAGAAVLIEKPLGTSLADAESLRAEAGRRGAFVAVAYVQHFQPAIQAMREVLRSGRLGRPLQAWVASGQHFPTFRPAYREIYYTRHETGGGAIQDALTHAANAIEWLVGPTTRVFCDAAHQSLEGVTVEDTVGVTARNGSVLTSYVLNQFQAPNEFTLQVNCEGGSVKADIHMQRWSEWARGADAWVHHAAPVNHRDDLFLAQAGAFLDGMAGMPTLLATLDEAFQTLRFNLAALKSARCGKMIELP